MLFSNQEKTLKKVKVRHSEIMLHIIMKDYQKNVSASHYVADNIPLILPLPYTLEEPGEELDD